MFKKFGKESISGQAQVKTSVARGIKSKLLAQFGTEESSAEPKQDKVTPASTQEEETFGPGDLDTLLPKAKQTPLFVVKCADRISLLAVAGVPVFFNIFDGPYFPTLRVLHTFDEGVLMPIVQVDRGAIRFVLKGADIMCPGLTSKGGKMEQDLPAGTMVAVHAEGKKHALAIGVLKLSTQDIRTINSGIGIETVHYLGDGLWSLTTF